MSSDAPQIPVNRHILKWAREKAGLSLMTAAQRAKIGDLKPRGKTKGVKAWQRLQQWENGESNPSFPQLKKIANAYRRPLLTFFLSDPPASGVDVADFRTIGDSNIDSDSPEFSALLRRIIALQHAVNNLVKNAKGEPVKFIGSGKILDDASEAASIIREIMNFKFEKQQRLGSGKIFGALRDKIEDLGIFVLVEGDLGSYHSSIPVDVFRGIALADAYAPIIVINANDSRPAKLFTLIHELAHLWLGETGISNLDALGTREVASLQRAEKYCNEIAAEFLIPANKLIALWNDLDNYDDWVEKIIKVAASFKVSDICAARRLMEVNLVSRDAYWGFYKRYLEQLQRIKEKYRESDGGPSYIVRNKFRLGDKMIGTVLDAVQAERISELDASQLLRVKIEKFTDLQSRAA
jgi:Zn-dependent peptidase ImmA (M78 family)/transcriptional regulator with XRE-family HTH domain